MKNLLPANRVALILHGVFVVASATAVFIGAVDGSLPHAWQADAALGVTMLGAIAGGTVAVQKFLDGSQKSEALQAAPLGNGPMTELGRQIAASQAQVLANRKAIFQGAWGAQFVAPDPRGADDAPYNPDPNFNPVSRLAPQREDEAARSPSNPEVPS